MLKIRRVICALVAGLLLAFKLELHRNSVTCLRVLDIAVGDLWPSFLIPVTLMVSMFSQYQRGNKGLVCKVNISCIPKENDVSWNQIVNS